MENNGSNTSSFTSTAAVSDQEVGDKVVVTSAYAIIFPVALFGNLLAIYIVISKRYMRSVTNLLLVNMFVGNLLVACVVMPYSVSFLFVESRWFGGGFGSFTCKFVHFAYALPIAASIFALLLSSVDRYFAVIYPFSQLHFIRNAKASTAMIWILSFCFISPYLWSFKVLEGDGLHFCVPDWTPLDPIESPKIYFSILFVALYFVPLAIMSTLYLMIGLKLWKRKIPGNAIRNTKRAAEIAKKKVVKMLIIVVVVFALSWIPTHSMHVLIFFVSERYAALPLILKGLAFWICHANSAISPCLFLVLSEKYRSGLVAIFRRRFPRSDKVNLSVGTRSFRFNSFSRNSATRYNRSSGKKDNETTLL
ncbi:neuromedin-K receptor-like [Actinia tenebrosa]|uniref:Neuromedin-K receptor-like n=1 Tax=Actinia tenebrosa TaxID=6105 RepID=A0A6P8IFK2_ACTTE|nr:neuromedin-K receptor-like [Actinia tenebrosa]XP_031565462.1 neuromedin-K receptor-like [Actinia tenebrosa]XP_031565463.1 neuromedin-K receptor-like [Actinia tenebrosa]XP_031565464.1 neuromedin-K receptor-like [Actinia tenebrosa]XP_031565465.1 neuromedin-K receptor-like [Actinia tenebrosa]XP_031565466.1 neuromedin-K receptor-like [Actinia tenebrosa]